MQQSSVVVRRLAAALVVAVALGACSGGDEDRESADSPSSTTTSDAAAVSTTIPFDIVPVDVVPVDDQTRAEVVKSLSMAFDAVRSEPALVTFDMVESGQSSAASIMVDQTGGLVDATWIQTTRRGSEIKTRNVVVDERAFFKSTTSPEAEQAISFVEVSYDRRGVELLESVFTAYGRVGPSLDRIIVVLESVPFEVAIEHDGDVERTTVVMDPADVVEFFRTSELERTGGHIPPEPVVQTFSIEQGRLVALEASGTQFHDGEALGVTATISYEPIEPFEVEVPAVDG